MLDALHPRWWRIAFAVLFCSAIPRLAGAHGGSFADLYDQVFSKNCLNCHSPSGGSQSGGFSPVSNEDAWYAAVVGVRPSNAAAAVLGKLRVTPYEPWNSLLVDKLTGDLKLGEGRPMPHGTGNGYVHNCPGAVEKLTKWILGGARQEGWPPGDDDCGTVACNHAQPPFSAPPPAGAIQLLSAAFQVVEPVRQGEQSTHTTFPSASDVLVGRIEVVTSAGTEYVVVTRGDDPAPLAVARDESLDLSFPQGVAVRLAANEPLEIRQRIRNDYWVCANATNPCTSYRKQTDGNVAVNFYPVADPASVQHEADPLVETAGTELLFAPPRAMGVTGGVWGTPGTAVNGALVGIWTDRRALEVAAVSSSGVTPDQRVLVPNPLKPSVCNEGPPPAPPAPPAPGLVKGYVEVAPGALGLVAYQCAHSNGFTNTNEQAQNTTLLKGTTSLVNRPMKFACLEMASPSPFLPPLPSGGPGFLGETAPKDCLRSIHDTPFPAYDDSECSGGTPDSCSPANLVGGEGVNDGRCTLIGLEW